jgi:hypothetical protein
MGLGHFSRRVIGDLIEKSHEVCFILLVFEVKHGVILVKKL